ncbi:serine hydrolase domain-containing protein [Litorimonas sp.]|uniref:serine hydrolase domain-containing protein n=1 Tax=Litorimonas sp. TaxID=1892381 RepID=UPI003A85E278
MKKLILGCAAAPLIFAANALAQNDAPTRQDRALAAGYKAMFTCSATFNGGKTPEQIAQDELNNIYGDYSAAMAEVPEAEIDAAKQMVSVSFADDMPPRLSVWREHLGCTALPQGATFEEAKHLPRVKLKAPKIDPAELAWPMGDRLPNAPLPSGIKSEDLDAAVEKAFQSGFGGATSAVLIVQNGRIIAEKYKDGFDKDTSQRTWSVAKSIAASVIGAAQQDGILDVKDKAGLEAWSRKGDPRAEITVENLLQMASGLNSDPAGNRTDNVYFGGGLVVQNASKNPLEAPPGARWRYANNDTMLAMRSLREAMGNDKKYFAYPFKALFHKIGMYDTNPEMDWGGDFVMSSQVWTTARDLARLGTLYLNDGVWEGERVLPEGWANYVAAPAPAQPENRLGELASEPGRGYGVQFWRYENYPGVPNDTYAALGNRGQFLIIIPSRQTVIVRRGYDWRGNYFDGPAFTAAILETLE